MKHKTFTLMIYEGTSTVPFTMEISDPHEAYRKFLEAVDFLNPHSVRLHNNDLNRDIFTFDVEHFRNVKVEICEAEHNMEVERKAQSVMRSCYSE